MTEQYTREDWMDLQSDLDPDLLEYDAVEWEEVQVEHGGDTYTVFLYEDGNQASFLVAGPDDTVDGLDYR